MNLALFLGTFPINTSQMSTKNATLPQKREVSVLASPLRTSSNIFNFVQSAPTELTEIRTFGQQNHNVGTKVQLWPGNFVSDSLKTLLDYHFLDQRWLPNLSIISNLTCSYSDTRSFTVIRKQTLLGRASESRTPYYVEHPNTEEQLHSPLP